MFAHERKPRPPRCTLDGAKLMRQAFLDEELMDYKNEPKCTLQALRRPRLRKCAFSTSTMAFVGPINREPKQGAEQDGGLDGYNWEVRFGTDPRRFVLKVFWDQEPQEPPYQYALQRECHNAAALQLMRAAMSQDDHTSGPILVQPHPWSRAEAFENMLAFSNEARLQEKLDEESGVVSPLSKITCMPRTRQCYGWVKIAGARIFDELPFKWWPSARTLEKKRRQIYREIDYTALVYEYIDEGDNDKEVIDKSLEFFRDAGFSHTFISLACNWKQSVLIDMSDIIHPCGFGWKYLAVEGGPFYRLCLISCTLARANPKLKLRYNMPTILEALTEPSVARDLNNEYAATGPNTIIDSAVEIENWSAWEDFTYENIKAIFKKQLGLRYQGGREPEPLAQDLFILNEDSTDDAIRRFPMPIVNYALKSAKGTEHFGRGSRCASIRYVPDWSVVADDHFMEGEGAGLMERLMDILPGDTKISSKWTSEIETDFPLALEWEKVVRQVVTYMAAWSVRYGFIVTDAEVVVLRIIRQHTTSGLASSRLRRKHSQASIATVTLSSDPVSDLASNWSSLSFQNNTALDWDFRVEFCAIPWSVTSRLTAKLALWALAMMSSHGDHFIDYSYPGLNTWRVVKGGGLVHNTSGAILSKAGKDCTIQQRNPFWDDILANADHNDAYDTEDGEAEEDQGEEEPALPEFSRYASPEVGSSSRSSDAVPSQTTTGKKRIEVRVVKLGRKYYYRDYKDGRKASNKDDWQAVEGGYLLTGKKHDYFTKKLG
ncbi:hypothetical protein LLEC1_06539 [Akanthomyces lecanii]|uniref:Uncharacterized protein n=1 Tax=Cordyceps confragosa TaxID=2714763 RepID=A0A179ITZ6_CORDF|nr:hypothetical protein LLEC1_06539 [Akanthomyces lecanii]